MATRGLATRTCTPVSSALRRRSGAAAPAAARTRCLDAFPSQNGNAPWGFSYNMQHARDLLKRAKKQEEVMRRAIKWFSRGIKTAEWACYFGVSATIAATVYRNRGAVSKP